MARSFFDEKVKLFFATSPADVVAMPVGQAAQSSEHMRFAVRGTFAAFVCYLFYMGTGWLGLGASIITCTLTARRLTGASRHRQSLRFIGFIVGAGVIGFGNQALVLPHVDSIAGYVLVFASVIWIGSWMATSGPRIAYSGFQLVLAYCLVNLNRFAVYTSLVPSRDKILGVVLGVVAMWLVFDHLWSKSSVLPVRNLLSGTLRRITDLKETPTESPREVNQWLAEARSRVNRNLDELRELADLYVFESFPKKVHESFMNLIRTALPELRVFLHVKAGLLQHGSVTAGAAEQTLLRDVETMTSGVLRGLADVIEGETQGELLLPDTCADELRARVLAEEERSRALNDPQKETEIRLCLSLLDSALDLDRHVRLKFVPDPS